MGKHNLKLIQRGGYVGIFAGMTLAYAIWYFWKKLTELIGDDILVGVILAVLLVIFFFTGHLSINKILDKF